MVPVLIILSCLLFLVLLAVLLRLLQLKREIRRFARETDKRRDRDYEQPLKVGCFDPDLVALANAVNRHTELQRSLAIEYERGNKQLASVISGISHDFRTPLTAALGYLQMVQKSDELSPVCAEYLDIAVRKNAYLKTLSDEFFELTKLEQGTEDTAPESLSLSNLLTECLLSQYQWIEARGITPVFAVEEGILVCSSRTRLLRILENLLSNAEKYACRRLEVSLYREGKEIVLGVCNDLADTAGVEMERIFEPFYRGGARSREGSGLGLYVVKSLAEKLGYTVSAVLDGQGLFTAELRIPDCMGAAENKE